jgi:5-methylcytosine-specific restriction enzyme A
MATSRTGTAQWKRARGQALAKAKRTGVTHCLHCKAQLNYDQGLLPNSAEPDHIIPWSMGGKDHVDNLVVICRRCNQSKGHRDAPKDRTVKPLKTSRKW